MFKGLKSKLEVEAKKLHASVQQCSEQFTQQIEYIRSTSSEAGSEGRASISRRFLSSVGGSSLGLQDTENSLDLSVSDTLMEEAREDLLDLDSSSRQRRLSCSSAQSTESSLSALFQSVPGLSGTTLESLDSDIETLDEYCSGAIKAATKDQISNMLSRLQSSASLYKSKYRDLMKKYNDVVSENNKFRTVLAQTQDKAFARIEKLKSEKKALGDRLREVEDDINKSSVDQKLQRYEDLLRACKAEIMEDRAKIKELNQENEKLSLKAIGCEATTMVDEVANEWKQRIEKVEKEWTERMNKNDSDHAIQLATTKAGMHAALEEKDREIESWRSKCRALEIQDGQANERWQKKVDELVQVVQALEVEKGDMVVKLSEAKQQGVKAVLDEEEEKREKLVEDFLAKEEAMRMEFEAKITELESMKDEEIRKLKSELDNIQSSLEAQNDMFFEVENLRAQLADVDERRREEIKEHRLEVTSLMKEHDEIVTSSRQQQIIELEALTTKFEQAREEAHELRIKNDALEKQLEELEQAHTLMRKQLEQTAYLEKSETAEGELRHSHSRNCESDEHLKGKLLECDNLTAAKMEELEMRSEISELRATLESRNFELGRMQMCKDELEAELAAAREFSAMYEHLETELKETHKQRSDIDSMITSLKERAEKAEKTLEDDRALLRGELFDLEGSSEQREDEELSLNSTSEVNTEKKAVTSDTVASAADISAHTAGQMDTADELRQLRAEIAHLNDVNAQLASKLHIMENELRSECRHHSLNLLEEHQTLKKGVNMAGELVSSERRFDNQTSQIMENIDTEHEDMCASSTSNLGQEEKAEDIVRLERELNEAKSQEQVARALYMDSENKCKRLQDRIDELMIDLDKASGDMVDIPTRARCETTEPGFQNRFDTEPDSISRRLTTDELLVSKERELEMTIVAKLELEARVLTLERDLSGWEERLEEATKVAAIESKNSLTTIQQLHEILEKQEAQLTELRLQLGEKEAIEGKEHDQEKVIAQLRAEIDDLQHQQEATTSRYEEKLRFAEDEIMALKAGEENATKSLAEMQEKFRVIEEKLHTVEKSREDEKLEGDRIRFEYEKALENLNCELVEANNRIQLAKPIEIECERLKTELCDIKKQCENEISRQKKESETAIRDLKLKAEKKLGKIKAATENDVTLAKAELALKIDELQRVLSERNCLIDKMVVEKARMEQKFIKQQEENELKYRQAKEVEKNVEIRVAELENKNRLLGEENSELVKHKEESNALIEESERNVKELQDKIRFLLDANENSSQKVMEKHDNENRKAFRELQKEIRQLYMELDVKTEALDTANARLFELESNSSKIAEEAIVPKHNHRSIDASPNHEIDEELELMRRKLNDSHKEVDELRETNSKLENLLKEQWKTYQNSPAVIKVSDSELHEGLGFSDPAEAEYLRNVLYRYMCSRENLGKEAVTLARVIGTVAKFSKSEMENVISREESRVAGWVGGTVSHVLTGR